MKTDDFLNMIQRGSAIPAKVNAVRIDANDGRVATLTRGDDEWTVEIFYGEDKPLETPQQKKAHVLRLLNNEESE